MNVAGVAAEAGGDATAVSECGLSVGRRRVPLSRGTFVPVALRCGAVYHERRSSQPLKPLIELFRNTFPVA
jgi:hypothetical protein